VASGPQQLPNLCPLIEDPRELNYVRVSYYKRDGCAGVRVARRGLIQTSKWLAPRDATGPGEGSAGVVFQALAEEESAREEVEETL